VAKEKKATAARAAAEQAEREEHEAAERAAADAAVAAAAAAADAAAAAEAEAASTNDEDQAIADAEAALAELSSSDDDDHDDDDESDDEPTPVDQAKIESVRKAAQDAAFNPFTVETAEAESAATTPRAHSRNPPMFGGDSDDDEEDEDEDEDGGFDDDAIASARARARESLDLHDGMMGEQQSPVDPARIEAARKSAMDMASMFSDHTGAEESQPMTDEDLQREEIFRKREQARKTRQIRAQDILHRPEGLSNEQLDVECKQALSSICAPNGSFDPQTVEDYIMARGSVAHEAAVLAQSKDPNARKAAGVIAGMARLELQLAMLPAMFALGLKECNPADKSESHAVSERVKEIRNECVHLLLCVAMQYDVCLTLLLFLLCALLLSIGISFTCIGVMQCWKHSVKSQETLGTWSTL
jgi:hypothetical protein